MITGTEESQAGEIPPRKNPVGAPEAGGADADGLLKDWVRRYKVTWERWPLREVVHHELMSVGFELRLLGRHEPSVDPSPGCRECVRVYDRLAAVAAAAFPTEFRPTRYEIEPFDNAFHLRPIDKLIPEVALTVRIVHRRDGLAPMDDCERRCVAEIQKNLDRLGVQQGKWSEPRAAPPGVSATRLAQPTPNSTSLKEKEIPS